MRNFFRRRGLPGRRISVYHEISQIRLGERYPNSLGAQFLFQWAVAQESLEVSYQRLRPEGLHRCLIC